MATTYYDSVQFTVTLASLASASARQSTTVSTDVLQAVTDYRIQVTCKTGTGTSGANKAVFVWVIQSNDGGTTFDGNAGLTDAAITLDSPHPFALGCVIPIATASTTRTGAFSLKAACGGSLPADWGIIVENQTGFPLSATEGDHVARYKEEYST